MAELITQTSPRPISRQQNDTINIKDLLYLFANKWYWFLISIVFCVGIAYMYILRTTPVYTRSASILIKDDGKGQSGTEADAFADLGFFRPSVNINNEIESLLAPDLMAEVVSRLHLDINYASDGTFHRNPLYASNLPVTVEFVDMAPSASASFVMELNDSTSVTLSDFKLGETEMQKDKTFRGAAGDTISTPLGNIAVSANNKFVGERPSKIYINKIPKEVAVAIYTAKMGVGQKNEKASIIQITCQDQSIARADDILNTLILVYNENWVRDKNQIAVSTSMFIDDRLSVIESELGNVDNDISSFKSENFLPDVDAAANMYMQQANQANMDIKDLNNKVYMARYVRNYLSNSANAHQLLPVTAGITDMSISSQISEYNKVMMERNSLVAHSSPANPLVQEMDNNLNDIRAALISSIDNQIISLNIEIKSLQGFSGQATSHIQSNPKQAKYLLSVERQQKVKESLYLYLLQKREENELSQAFTAYNTRLINKPGGSSVPTAPVRSSILLIAFVIGLALPALVIFMKESLNTVVRGRKDLETLTIPFVGEIPLASKPKRTWYGRIIKTQNQHALTVVKPHSRNVINEAFRVVRTNLEFMVGPNSHGNVIAVTSASSNSGKTFISFNLATSLAIKDKKAIVVDLDLRKGSASKYASSPKTGVSNYLAGQTDNVRSIICQDVENQGLDVIPIGVMPPNPTELLFNGRLETLIEALKHDYDYIFLDCPPVEIVADAAIINQVADMTVFVIRSTLFERSMLPVIQKYYDEKKFRNMTILLNGTDGGNGRYGSKYGYRYGYQYGYHYGYANTDE